MNDIWDLTGYWVKVEYFLVLEKLCGRRDRFTFIPD